jgi:hypothetical protein
MTLATLLCGLLYAVLACVLATLDWPAISPLAALLAALLGIFLADLLSGIIHVYLDYVPFPAGAGIERVYFYVGPRDTREYLDFKAQVFRGRPLIDRLSFSFKIHHWKPKAMNRKTYAEHALETIAPAFPIALLAFVLPPSAALGAAVTAFLVANIQFIHACIHDTPRSVFWKKAVRLLQRLRVIYSFETHMEHHRHGQKNFCLITGWANVALNPLCALLFRRGVLKQNVWDSLRPATRAMEGDDAAI